MANEFRIRNGFFSEGNSNITGSLTVTGGITGSFSGSGTVTSASYALNADLLDGKDSTIFATTGSNTFNGNQIISGSINVSGSIVMQNGQDIITHHVTYLS